MLDPSGGGGGVVRKRLDALANDPAACEVATLRSRTRRRSVACAGLRRLRAREARSRSALKKFARLALLTKAAR
jgi:hypothetical protein